MISHKDIIFIAFSLIKKHKVDCSAKVINYKKFKILAKKSPFISEVIREGFTFKELNLPAIIYHKNKDCIFFCKEVLERLLKNQNKRNQKKFIKSIVLHELLHIKNRKNSMNLSLKNSLALEEEVFNKFKKDYPELFNLSYKIIKKSEK